MSMTQRKTIVGINGQAFTINGVPTYAGREYNGHKVEGLLMNSRMVQGVFDDLNPETRSMWDYSEGPWDPDRNTDEFLAAMPSWREAGLLGFTINLQGGSPQGYSKEQPWHNSAFTGVGELRPAYLSRLERILDRADELGMVAIVGYFYFGQDQRLSDEAAVIRATEAATDWLLEKGYTNVLIEIANEVNIAKYVHPIIKEERCHELIELVKERSARRLLVSTSNGGRAIPKPNIVTAADFLLLHGNGVTEPPRIGEMVKTCRGLAEYRGQPILFNEDDHFAFDQPENNMLVALAHYAGWGFFDYRMQDEGYHEGYQSVPVDWRPDGSERKRGFFGLLREVTGG
jgi:hypothetical protein